MLSCFEGNFSIVLRGGFIDELILGRRVPWNFFGGRRYHQVPKFFLANRVGGGGWGGGGVGGV